MIDLQKYCATDGFRSYLQKPFNIDEFTYATDGRIMVRVPVQAGYGPPDAKLNWNDPLKGFDAAVLAPFAHKAIPPLPPSTQRDCEECDGRKTEHDCPDCEHPCQSCNGSGLETITPEVSTTIGGYLFNLRYVALMLELPGVVVQTNYKEGDPLLFKFDGGEGAIMPRRSKCEQHVEIEAEKAA